MGLSAEVCTPPPRRVQSSLCCQAIYLHSNPESGRLGSPRPPQNLILPPETLQGSAHSSAVTKGITPKGKGWRESKMTGEKPSGNQVQTDTSESPLRMTRNPSHSVARPEACVPGFSLSVCHTGPPCLAGQREVTCAQDHIV